MIISIDNGVTGAIAVIDRGRIVYHENVPVKKELSYTKEKKWINRIDYPKLLNVLYPFRESECFIERPMVNPGRFLATMSAIRCLEATLIALETLGISVQYLDSREWQKAMLPKGLKGDELKDAAKSIAKRRFPNLKIYNADALLIALYAYEKFNRSEPQSDILEEL